MVLPSTWKKLNYHPVQSALWSYTGRFAAIVAGRQSGKTEICMRKLTLQLPIKKPWADPLYFYVCPTFQQARRVGWDRFLKLIPKEWIPKGGTNKQDGSIKTIFGSTLYVLGADKTHRLEGNAADWILVDESSDQRPELYVKTIRPMLAMRGGTCYRLGVPKRSGIGRVEFRDFFNKGVERKDGIASFFWKSSEVWSEEEINSAKSQMSELDYAEQCDAEWKDQGGTVYYGFVNDNVRDDISYDPTQEINVGCDFNVDPMCWTLSHYQDGKLYVFDEIMLRNTNTQATLDFIHNKYYQHLAGWRFFGDASSRARHTPATKSDYMIIKNDIRFGQKKVYFPKRNPHIRDRVASVNAAFKNAKGDIRIYISYNCKRLINDFNTISYVEGTSEVEDYRGTDIGHMSDAMGYVIHSLMPVELEITAVPSIYSAA